MFSREASSFRRTEMTVTEKLLQMSWSYILIICCVAGIGVIMLYSAANGDWEPWARRQGIRFCVGLGVMIFIALTDIRIWMRYAYLIYIGALGLLLFVELGGATGMGAQRWIDLGFFLLQPSEVMKIALVLVLARFFHSASLEEVHRIGHLIFPLALTIVPTVLIIRQPDLGTALMLLLLALALFFLGGVQAWKFGTLFGLGLISIPLGWMFVLRDYQKDRILTFLYPERDPLGAGYHIMQSKITMGSGGLFGKGFLQGSQSHLNFLPEKQTDFIFTMLAEEFGMVGGLVLLALYLLLVVYGYVFALKSTNHFGRLLAIGLTTNFFIYLFVNIAMVMGLIPVVGAPLPLISYGGTALMAMLVGFGLIECVHIHQDIQIGRHGASTD